MELEQEIAKLAEELDLPADQVVAEIEQAIRQIEKEAKNSPPTKR